MDENIQNTSIIFVVYPISYLLCSKIVWLFIGMGFHKNTLRRIDLVCDIVRKHYEPGRRDRCYKEVWRRYVNPVYTGRSSTTSAPIPNWNAGGMPKRSCNYSESIAYSVSNNIAYSRMASSRL